jgi:hypothetical protein
MSGAETILVVLIAANAALVFGYRVFRLSKGGPAADAIGGAILAVILGIVAVGAGSGAAWARWAALVYAALFALVVMPIWTLGVLIPLPPTGIDYAFTALYWASLIAIAMTALFA